MTRRAPNVGFAPRRGFAALTPYLADSPTAPLHLADNTNAFGVPPSALQAIQETRQADVVEYPPSSGPRLREAIASYLGVQPNEVVLGCGADDVIDCSFRAFCEPGQRVAFPDPTFVMARYFALSNGLTPVPVPVRPGGAADAAALLATEAAVVYICAPNNPTGLQPAVSDLRMLLDRAKGVVMIDEAYAEFTGETLVREVVQHARAIVVRTFSKAFGLAGLRIGYAIGPAALVLEIEKARGPFAVSNVALRAATVALANDLAWVQGRVQEAIAAREELVRLLRERSFAPLPSAANFVLVPVTDARRIAERLSQRGIGVRAFTRLTQIGDALRITVAPLDAMRRVADALVEVSQ
ncbi:MAG: pyridoxal phosphate-dependent aminotransferase [Gemmatimonadaceae bacterium]